MPEIPDWVVYTPPENDYELAVWIEGDEQQSIKITRAEFIALKKHLAAMRGYTLGDFRDRIEKLKTEAPAGWENTQTVSRTPATCKLPAPGTGRGRIWWCLNPAKWMSTLRNWRTGELTARDGGGIPGGR